MAGLTESGCGGKTRDVVYSVEPIQGLACVAGIARGGIKANFGGWHAAVI